MSYTICNVYSLPSTYASSSLRAQLYDSNNNAVGGEISTGFYKRMGSTTIFAHALTVPDSHVGWCDVYVAGSSSVIIACIPINPQEVENSDAKSSTLATPGNVSDTQTAITNAIAALNNLSTSDVAAALTTYDPPTKAELDAAQSAIIDAVPTVAEIDTELSGNHGAGSWEDSGGSLTAAQVWSYADRTLTAFGSAAGVEFTYTVTDSATTNPIADVSVWFSTNDAITNVIWYGSTDAFGVARDANGNKPRLDPGTYHILCRKTGYSFTLDTETVS